MLYTALFIWIFLLKIAGTTPASDSNRPPTPLGSLQGETFENYVDKDTAQAFWHELHHAAEEERLVEDEDKNPKTADKGQNSEENHGSSAEVDKETAKIFWETVNKNKDKLYSTPDAVDVLLKEAELLETSDDESGESLSEENDGNENLNNLLSQAFDKNMTNKMGSPRNLEVLDKLLGPLESGEESETDEEIQSGTSSYPANRMPGKFIDFPNPDTFLDEQHVKPIPILAIDPPAKERFAHNR